MNIPGFIDLQVNGYKGVGFSSLDLTEEKFIYACHELFNVGIAAFLPTLITSSKEVYERNLPLISAVINREEFRGKLLGIHLEGPFISGEQGAVGAHNPEYVCSPSMGYLEKLQDWASGNVKLLTIAAELPEADTFTRYAADNGITVSLGHQMALENDLNKLAKAGAKALTHLGNALPNKIDRHHNPIWAGLAQNQLSAMIITDGHHLPDSMIKTIIKSKGTDNVIIVSDISPVAGLSAGEYKVWGNDVVLKDNGFLYVKKTGHLAGSSATMLECMNCLTSLNLLDEEELLKVGFYNPLALIGINPKSIKSDYSLVYNKNQNTFGIER